MKNIFSILLILASFSVSAQSFEAENQEVFFYSEAALDNFEASSTDASYLFNSSDYSLKISIPLSSFQFEASMKQSEISSSFLNLDEFPEAVFEGKVEGVERKNGEQEGSLIGHWYLAGKKVSSNTPIAFRFGQGDVVLSGVMKLMTDDFALELPEDLEFYISDECQLTFSTTMNIINR
jgi:hypothetical protein